ncbi:MAG TPA: hypothetical protein VFL03_12400 [Candidatus Limnocylindrales bacterium]|nr:hypothetical protein [Candidatus Limnocylindrales bacterium]
MSRYGRPVAFGLAVVLLGFLVVELAIVIPRMRPEALGVDFHQYLEHTKRWLDGGSLYLDRQLQGPYQIEAGDSLYPPPILYLTVPFVLGLPQVLWWAIPLGVIGLVMARLRPAWWTWPILAAMVATPRSIEVVMYGNPVMWCTAALAAGTILGWPSVFVLLKPSLAPLALWGVRRRSWWVALLVALVAALPFGVAWLEWIQVVKDSSGSLLYSIPDLFFVLLPVVAWLGRTRSVEHLFRAPGGAATAPEEEGRAAILGAP